MYTEKNCNPTFIAREALKQLAALKIPPTPDNYHKLYDQIAGKPHHQITEVTARLLTELAKEFPRHTPVLLTFANTLEQAANEKNWPKFKSMLIKHVTTETVTSDHAAMQVRKKTSPTSSWGEIIENLFMLFDRDQCVTTVLERRRKCETVLEEFSFDAALLQNKLIELIDLWQKESSISRKETDNPGNLSSSISNTAFSTQDCHSFCNDTKQLLGLTAQMLKHMTSGQLGNELLTEEAKTLANQAHEIHDKQQMKRLITHIQQFCIKLESRGGNGFELQQGMLRLLNLLMDNTEKLLSEDQWVKQQISKAKAIISRPLDTQTITQAEQYLEEITQKQALMRNCLDETKVTIKQMATSLIANLEVLSGVSENYQNKLEYYSEKINQSSDIQDINLLLTEVMQETRQIQNNVSGYRKDLLSARTEIRWVQTQMSQLEIKLLEMSEQAYEDHLTGALNRRGFDNAYQREVSLARRQQTPLCFALLDLDNFKRLNDTYGHDVGDEVLVHLTAAVKESVRLEDIVSRYGGEEFAILLPNTELDAALLSISRVRRHLIRKFFLHENNRLLITFSAGVAQYQSGESQESLYKRADKALYRAKKNGKNQIVAATEPPVLIHA